MYIMIGIGVLACIVAGVRWALQPGADSDFGSVSNQWVAEHRLSQTQDSQR